MLSLPPSSIGSHFSICRYAAVVASGGGAARAGSSCTQLTKRKLPDLADRHDDGGIQCSGLHPVLPQGLLQPTTCSRWRISTRTSPPQDPHGDGQERKVKQTRSNLFREPAGHDPDVNHLLLEGEEEGDGQGEEELPQLENLTGTAYTSGGEPTEDEFTEDDGHRGRHGCGR